MPRNWGQSISPRHKPEPKVKVYPDEDHANSIWLTAMEKRCNDVMDEWKERWREYKAATEDGQTSAVA